MDLKEFKAKYPDLYKLIFEEGSKAGKADGFEEGRQAGIEEGKAESREEALVAGAQAETQRIKDIEALLIPGHEALVQTLKFDGKTTAAEAAIKLVQAEKGVQRATADALAADGVKPVAHAAAPAEGEEGGGDGAPEGPDKWKAQYEKDSKLQAEFKTFSAYEGYMRGVASGRVKILRKTV